MSNNQEENAPTSQATTLAASGGEANQNSNETAASEGGTKKGGNEKKKPSNIVIPPKKKLSKAERRARQEAQRAAKGQRGDGGANKGGGNRNASSAGPASSVAGTSKDAHSKESGGQSSDTNDKTLNFFSHLPPYKAIKNEFSGAVLGLVSNPTIDKSKLKQHNLHPAILSLGLQYTTGTIRGANSRAKAMLQTFQIAIADYHPAATTSSSDIRYSMEHDLLKPAFNYLSKCRTHSVTMGNAFSFVKKFVMDLDRDIDLDTIKKVCCDAIDVYIQERILFADKAIGKYACTKIVHGDVILTYANSEVIQSLLLHAHETFQEKQKSFRVIVVDSRPLLEGRKTLEILTKAGIECSYIFLNSLSYVMKEVTKVFMGAAALMSDGSIMSRVGTASVALIAESNNIPVLFCCETYKITSRVQLESITGNELGNPDDLLSTHCAIDRTKTSSNAIGEEEVLKDWRSLKSLKLLNLLYDLTPSMFVSGIVTEMGILPTTSVAVLLREMNPQDNDTTFKANP